MRGRESSDLVRLRGSHLGEVEDDDDGDWGDLSVRVLFGLLDDEWWMETVVGFEWES